MSQRDRKAMFSSVEDLGRKRAVSEMTAGLQATLVSISRQHLGAIGSLQSLAEQGVRAVEKVAEEVEAATATAEDTMVRFEWHLSATRDAMSDLGARFDWGMSEVLASLGGMRDSLASLVSRATTPAQTAAYEQFEIGRDAFRRHLYPECLRALELAIEGNATHPGYALEWRFHMLRGVVKLGELDEVDANVVDRQGARESFLAAARYAENDEPREAARALLAASRASYVGHDVHNALETVQEAIRLAPEMAESHYRAAKYRAESDAFEAALPSLRATVRADPSYLLKIAADPTFQKHPDSLDGFLSGVRDERLQDLTPLVREAAEAVRPWADRSKDVSGHPGWGRWKAILGGGQGWGFFDLHRYYNEGLTADKDALGHVITALADLEEQVRASLAALDAEISSFAEIRNHAVVHGWRSMLDSGRIELAYSDQIAPDRERVIAHAQILEELEARVLAAWEQYRKLAENSERLAGHQMLARWKEMVHARRWTRDYAARFEEDLQALQALIAELSVYRVERVITRVERELEETTEERRWIFKRRTRRRIRRLVDHERTVLANGLGDRFPGPEMIDIPPGEFTMGPGPDEDATEWETTRRVALTVPFQMAATPVTQQLYEAVMAANPSPHQGIFRPVHGVSWYEAVRLCNKLSAMFGYEPAYEIHESMLGVHVRWRGHDMDGFRLPTDAEWEFACRGGDPGQRYGELDAIAWHRGNSGDHPHPVGRKSPNAPGLYDMLGNVENWVWDFAPEQVPERVHRRSSLLRRTAGGTAIIDATDPTGPARGEARISRGDAFGTEELEEKSDESGFIRRFRSASKRARKPSDGSVACGIRLARTPS